MSMDFLQASPESDKGLPNDNEVGN
jgi:hypothetical protein